MVRTWAWGLMLAIVACSAVAQTSPAFPTREVPRLDGEVPLDEYLSALQQISPVARDAVDDYLAAYARRCGRPLATHELRRRVAEGNGDAQLMAMIRATQLRDEATLRQLRATLDCGSQR
jgi:hypothetical protein